MKSFYTVTKTTWLLSLNLLFISQLCAQKYSNEFLALGVGARAQGMGNSVIASADDVTAGYWNPAGLANFTEDKGLQLGAMHSEWFAGVGKYDFIGMTLPFSNHQRRLGLSLIRFGVDGIPNTLSLYGDDGSINYDNIVEFSAADYAMLGSYAQKIKIKEKLLLIGGNVKIVRRVIGSFANSWGFGIDLGAQYRSGNWRFGLTGKDITQTYNAWRVTFTEKEKEVLLATGNQLPDINSVEVTRPRFQFGAAYQMKFNKFAVLPELDLNLTTDGERNVLLGGKTLSLDPSLGAEVAYNNFLFLRSGISQVQKIKDFDGEHWDVRPSLGVGLQLYSLRIDYAYNQVGSSDNRYSHVVSLLLDIKPKVPKS